MQIVDHAPDDRPLVVRPSRRYFATRIALAIPLLCAVLLLLALVLWVLELAGPALLAVVAWLAILLALVVLGCVRAWRGAIHRGPSVAADATGLWLRLDPNSPSRTRVAYLTWSEVERIETQTWPLLGRGGAYLCVYAPAAAGAATADRTVRHATREVMAAFGTPFIISDQAMDTDFPTMLAILRELAGSRITSEPHA